MNESEQLLALLRDIQEPLAPEGVSLWLIAANAALLLLIVAGLLLRRRRRRERWRKEALQHIDKASAQSLETGLLSLAKLLRQVMHYHGHDLNSDSDTWLAQLDEAFDTDWFTKAEGQIFGNALYQKPTGSLISLPLLCKKLKGLIKSMPLRAELSSHAEQVTHTTTHSTSS